MTEISTKPTILVIDNYDSFTYNLVQYLGELQALPIVYRNDKISASDVREMDPDGIIISPGPGTPQDPRRFGVSLDIIKEISSQVPTLGVCLGHQGIGFAYGAEVVRADILFHGKTTKVYHRGTGLFKDIPNGFQAARYHSLILDVDSIPSTLEVTAETSDGEIMGIKHVNYPVFGVQFHPESVLTEHGKNILSNYLSLLGGIK